MTDTKEELVTMPIPIGALPAVHDVLARYYQSRLQVEAPPGVEDIEERVLVRNLNGDSHWTRDEVRELYLKFRNPVGRAAIRPVAQAKGGPVLYGQMAEAAGLEVDQLRAQLAWLAKYAKQVKGGEHRWPLQLDEDPTKPKGERYTYRMPARVALWWLEIDTETHATYDAQTEEHTPLCEACDKPLVAVTYGGHVCTNTRCDRCFVPQETWTSRERDDE